MLITPISSELCFQTSLFHHVAISSTSELKTKLGNVVVISLQIFMIYVKQNYLTVHLLGSHKRQFVIYLRYGRVMILSNDGFLFTKSLHSSLSIFPSWFTSASSNVCSWMKRKKETTFRNITSKCINSRRKQNLRQQQTLSSIISMVSSANFISDSQRRAINICLTCKNITFDNDVLQSY